MRRTAILLAILIGIFRLFVPTKTFASLIKIQKNGELLWNVLAQSDAIGEKELSFLKIESGREYGSVSGNFVSLRNNKGNVSLVVKTDSKTYEFVPQKSDDYLVEIEERANIRKILIGVGGDNFVINEEGTIAKTHFPIDIDVKLANLIVKTPSGDEFLTLLPKEALKLALRTKLLNELSEDIEVVEKDGGLHYKVSGNKVLNILDIFEYRIPLTLFISAKTGEINSLDSPTIFKYLKFLFV